MGFRVYVHVHRTKLHTDSFSRGRWYTWPIRAYDAKIVDARDSPASSDPSADCTLASRP